MSTQTNTTTGWKAVAEAKLKSVAQVLQVPFALVVSGRRHSRQITDMRALIAFYLRSKLGLSATDIGDVMKISAARAYQWSRRGEELACSGEAPRAYLSLLREPL